MVVHLPIFGLNCSLSDRNEGDKALVVKELVSWLRTTLIKALCSQNGGSLALESFLGPMFTTFCRLI